MWENSESIYSIVLRLYTDEIPISRSFEYIKDIIFTQVKQVAEDTKFLWGRRDDESCLAKLKDNLNSTSLAEYCGIFSR